jgi:hypothetical protein
MKQLLYLLIFLLPITSNGQNFFKDLYKDFLKYGTVYAAGNVGNAKMESKEYFIRTNPDNLYEVPTVIDETVYHPHDYRFGVGIRKIARFDYEIKGANFYNGIGEDENTMALSAPTAAVKGLEYLLHWEKQRVNGDEFDNQRLFVRHTGKYHILKFESRESGNVGFEYKSGEIRGRLPIGKKFSISVGAIWRTHQQPYGYNPIEIWLNETEFIDNGQGGQIEVPVNNWWELGYLYGYNDIFYQSQDELGNQTYDWYWVDGGGEIVAYSDIQFRDDVYFELMNRFNKERWAELDPFAEIAPIVGFDFYHYKRNFWLHAYGNWILPHHKYVAGNEDFSYLHRNSWGKGGHNDMLGGEQWDDYQVGVMFGWKVGRKFGIFIEGEYTQFWDSKIYATNFGINLQL